MKPILGCSSVCGCLRAIIHHNPSFLLQTLALRGRWQKQLADICQQSGFDYHYVNDHQTFSAACARNLGAARVKTDLIFFMDIDCFGETDFFSRIVVSANAINLGGCFDQIVNVPLYHLTESATAQFRNEAESERGASMSRLLANAVLSPPQQIVDYIDPCSNMFLCHRSFFELTGGFNETFRGHGSEDFEFLLRFAVLSQQFPLPQDVGQDHYGPLTRGFYRPRPYRGFRRLFEVMAYQGEIAGLRLAHLDHPRPRSTPWHRQNDRGRKRFEVQTRGYLKDPHSLLACDWLPRAHGVFSAEGGMGNSVTETIGALLPLRLAGYKIDTSSKVANEATIRERRSGSAQATIQRGILPDSWSYSSVIANRIDSTSLRAMSLTEAQLEVAREYLAALADTEKGRVAVDACKKELAQLQQSDVSLEGFTAFLAFHHYAFCAPSPKGGPDLVYAWSQGTALTTTRAALTKSVNKDSYLAARLSMNHSADHEELLRESKLAARVRKFSRNPKRFLRDSRFALLRRLARQWSKHS